MFVFDKESILKNCCLFYTENFFIDFFFYKARSCEIDLSDHSTLQEIKLFYEDFLFLYVKNQKTKINELCFSVFHIVFFLFLIFYCTKLSETNEIPYKEFFFSISSENGQNTGQLIDIYSIKLYTDYPNTENQPNNPEKDLNNKEFEPENENNLHFLQEKIKRILLIQVIFIDKLTKNQKFFLYKKIEQMQKLQHIKHYNSLSLKDMKNEIKFFLDKKSKTQ